MDRLDADGFMRCLLAAHAAEDAFVPARHADDLDEERFAPSWRMSA